MKVLMLGDPNAYFRQEFSKHMRENVPGIQIDIISNLKYKNEQKIYDNSYVMEFNKSKNLFSKILMFRKEMKQVSDYDVIHVHSVSLVWLICIDILKRKSGKIVLTYYGSDYFKANKIYRFLFYLFNNLADYVVFANSTMRDKVVKRISKHLKRKTTIIPFGISSFSEIDNIRSERKIKFKNEFGISDSEMVISVGYNSQKEQNHIEVLNIIENLKDLNKKITIVLPMNYGNKDNLSKIKAVIDNYSYKIIISEVFLNDKEIAKIRYISDVMIHVQDSDQFSASVAEYLYSENVVINGNWIKYDEYEDLGIYYERIASIDVLGGKLKEIVNNFDLYKKKINAHKLLKMKFDWEITCEKYEELYFR